MKQNCILLFTRYPQPGEVKTRLIERLGARGAADLHARMTEKVLQEIATVLESGVTNLQLFYSNSGEQAMRDWLGKDICLCPQQGKDLGQRMEAAFEESFQQGAERVVLVGSDCPALDHAILRNGLEKLNRHDLVLGPAVDGGYYLIGLSAAVSDCSFLFTGIDWGTDQVLEQTLRQAEKISLSHTLLPQLHDIDRPEDLVHCRL
jgi:rSAM/selenodomain-associated transferase 1